VSAARVAGAVAVAVLGAALLGPAAAPGDPVRTVAAPWAPPGPGLPLGADAAGRDVAARVAAGGAGLTAVALVAAVAASAAGVAGGLWAGWGAGRAGTLLTAAADLLLALPLLLVALVLAVALPGPLAVVAATVAGGAPLTLRVVADATRRARVAGYVEAARARGERTAAILAREVLPSLAGLVAADAVLRCVLALQLAAALSLLGLGAAPPAPDWAAMVRENLPGLRANPAALLAPAGALAAVTVAVAGLAAALTGDRR